MSRSPTTNAFELRDMIAEMRNDTGSPLFKPGHLDHARYVQRWTDRHEWLHEVAPTPDPAAAFTQGEGYTERQLRKAVEEFQARTKGQPQTPPRPAGLRG